MVDHERLLIKLYINAIRRMGFDWFSLYLELVKIQSFDEKR